ncbi:ankyrin repeat and SOCS box protein 5-like isoform X2 [Acipenser ruthenus]|uniref:ankyrin repeat and SOCS box protein 5-like isoform X2 n=1 Tax=Acipenser ruthenus TaxID=7906 RepID=UPI00145A9E54|nr:ankyrin repeat and SOCS box protein 5-like isoform X2 [Acipenser ruthenus]
MPKVPSIESNYTEQTSRKRRLEITEDFPAKKKSSWGILTCQDSINPGAEAMEPALTPAASTPAHDHNPRECPLRRISYYRTLQLQDGAREGIAHPRLCEEAEVGSWADRSPLHEAASQGRLLALKTLLSQGYNANTLTIDYVTPLHEACLGDHVACARALIEAGANVNATTIDGMSPLFNACSQGSATCVEILLEHGANPQSDACQPSPIHEASSKGRSECVAALISWGADVDQTIPHLGTPLYVACISQQLHCTQKLLDGGANVQKGKFLETPLHAAAQQNSPEVVKLLLDFGADINVKNLDLKRPVEAAAPSSLVEKFLLLHEATPCSLRQLCRLSIRNSLGRSRQHLISQLQLPTILQNFLQYR